ncbi:hypothetical protein [Micromonospora sp. CB01531]|uniref:hypothetical protein n=1 Tax=Micromonospora sp. CB01531 TaxID=1718947 RepID=UPI00093ED321|nr:hypothetical protein [Micromonospora sp. CB01531]OKI42775.1 hypothetical protein A6A27_39115 [Micromonospora sp. CB01531]
MIVQWCCKGLAKLDRGAIQQILTDPTGLRCRDWESHWQRGGGFPVAAAIQRLTEENLDRHVNNFSSVEPTTGRKFCDVTPFISLSAGCVDRDVAAKTNITHRALRTALEFATTDYAGPAKPACPGWVLYCYVLVGSNPAVRIPTVAEEIRELNHGRAYSGWYWQGEVAAKLHIPSAQILCAERYEPAPDGRLRLTDLLLNLNFCHPAALLAERSML